VSKLPLVRSSLEGYNGIVGVKAVEERSNNGSWIMGFNRNTPHFFNVGDTQEA
jgi:hypothetical protein